jgi:hypothetical protein
MSIAVENYARTGRVVSSAVLQRYEEDQSSVWVFVLDGDEEKYTARMKDDLRHPVVGDAVLVLLLKEFKNHAKEVIYDADLRQTSRILGEK